MLDQSTRQDLQLAATARQAWEALPASVIDAADRDKDFVALIWQRLDQTAPSFEAALDRASLPQFVGAFFLAAAPFADMLKDILQLFTQAGATDGPMQWRLKFDDYEVDLAQFKRLAEHVTRMKGYVEYPAGTFLQIWDIVAALKPAGQLALDAVIDGDYSRVPQAGRSWVQAYQTRYAALPAGLAPPQDAPGSMHAVWGVIRRALHELRLAGTDRKQVLRHCLSQAPATSDDAFAPRTLGNMETDYFLRTLVVLYASAMENNSLRAGVLPKLDGLLGDIPTKSELIDTDIGELIEFLGLPIWERRHEFYAAWVGAKLVAACAGHTVRIFHDEGAITFPFKETNVARIASAVPERMIVAEKRSPLISPRGAGRQNAVQPDFGIWRSAGTPRCDLVVEVKHYKRAARASWIDVFIDYAGAHGDAPVVLVNYGPAGHAIEHLPPEIAARCSVIGDLRPGNQAAVAKLDSLVKTAVGRPLPGKQGMDGDGDAPAIVLLLDVSGSMPLTGQDARSILDLLKAEFNASHVAVANTCLGGLWAADDAGLSAASSFATAGSTDFENAIADLLEQFGAIVLITDEDGRDSLNRSAHVVQDIERSFSAQSRIALIFPTDA